MAEFPFRVVWVRPAGPRRGMARRGAEKQRAGWCGGGCPAPVGEGGGRGQMKAMSQWTPPPRGIS